MPMQPSALNLRLCVRPRRMADFHTIFGGLEQARIVQANRTPVRRSRVCDRCVTRVRDTVHVPFRQLECGHRRPQSYRFKLGLSGTCRPRPPPSGSTPWSPANTARSPVSRSPAPSMQTIDVRPTRNISFNTHNGRLVSCKVWLKMIVPNVASGCFVYLQQTQTSGWTALD